MGNSKPGVEPLRSVLIKGMVHNVPQSRAELEEVIGRAAELQDECDQLSDRLAAKAPDVANLIEHHRAEIKRLTADLETERAPFNSLLTTKQTQLNLLKEQMGKLSRPLMGEQKSMKITGVAATIMVERDPKMTVEKTQIPALRNLLKQDFPQYFEVEEKAKPLKKAWDLLKTLTGRRLATFQAAVTTTDLPRVRFVPAGQ